MSYIPGLQIVLQFDGKTIVGYRNTGMDIEAELKESTTGASTNKWKEYIPLQKGMSFTVDGLYDPDTSSTEATVADVIALIKAGTSFTALWGGTVSGNPTESVTAYIQKVHIDGPYDDLSSYSIDCLATGEPTTGTVA